MTVERVTRTEPTVERFDDVAVRKDLSGALFLIEQLPRRRVGCQAAPVHFRDYRNSTLVLGLIERGIRTAVER
ncbi:MAG: hypothetical protein ACREYE_03845 [Gammaproteobacteria bacterium]